MIGRESRECICESEGRRDSREPGQVLQKWMFLFANRFARIKLRVNLRNIGVRIAGPV